jgi:isoamylase
MDEREVVPAGWARSAEPGSPGPLGATLSPTGTNFAVHAPAATRVTLVLFAPGGLPRGERVLDPATQRTGGVWHVLVPGLRAGAEYAWRADSDTREPGQEFDPTALLIDPYAKGVAGSERWGERIAGGRSLRSVVCDLAHDGGAERRPSTPFRETVIYETHVRAFTMHPSARVRSPGTYAGLTERIPWLRALGVTAVQLMPVAEFDETDNPRVDPATGQRLLNAWGYAPLAFMAPKLAYASDRTASGALREFRDMVAALHAAGLEVILDVVFNHTGEGGRGTAPRSWRGLDRPGYFLLDERGRDIDHTGTGHTFACATPVASRLILDTLRFWARDMHVDGFRFDLASTLTRGLSGEPLEAPPLLRAIATDPVLAPCKLIAEPWDIGLYHVGRFPEPGRFVELNGRFRDDVRDWLRAAPADAAALMARLNGSPELYQPLNRSVNFLTSHDGYTLGDLVSYERKHNEANGEGNRDGGDDNRSWNGGVEGPAENAAVRAIRARQVRNAAALLLLARGAVLWLWGDEVLRTQRGNNNPWCQDGPEWWLDWDTAERGTDFTRFVRGLLALRREHAALREGEWQPLVEAARPGRWLEARAGELLLVVNGEPSSARFGPPAARDGRRWRRLVDTAAEPPADVAQLAEAPACGDTLELEGRSLVLLLER